MPSNTRPRKPKRHNDERAKAPSNLLKIRSSLHEKVCVCIFSSCQFRCQAQNLHGNLWHIKPAHYSPLFLPKRAISWFRRANSSLALRRLNRAFSSLLLLTVSVASVDDSFPCVVLSLLLVALDSE